MEKQAKKTKKKEQLYYNILNGNIGIKKDMEYYINGVDRINLCDTLYAIKLEEDIDKMLFKVSLAYKNLYHLIPKNRDHIELAAKFVGTLIDDDNIFVYDHMTGEQYEADCLSAVQNGTVQLSIHFGEWMKTKMELK